jgi:folate-binding protein YgfZ
MTLAALVEDAATALVPYDGAAVPSDFGDVAAEHAALRSGAGMMLQAQRRVIDITGSERVEFLQGQLSNDVTALSAGGGQAALLLSALGKVEALVGVYDTGERLEILSDAAAVDRVRERIEKFLVADDVEVEVEAPPTVIALGGPAAAGMLAGLISRSEAEFPAGWSVWSGEVCGLPARVFARGDLGVPFYELVFSIDPESVWSALATAGATPAGASAFEILRVESGTARYGVDVDDSRIALEARLEWAIHFAKGCYVGQEVVERAVSRGRLHRRLALLASTEPLAIGAVLDGGSERDVVTSSVVSPDRGPLALAYLGVERTAAGSEVTMGDWPARVLEWPRPEVHAGRAR